MTSGANGEWVRQGTPRDDADWNKEQSEYGTALSPTEWDDYSSEQSVPVAAPRAQTPEGAPTADSPDTPEGRDPEPVPGQEPDAEEDYRSNETETGTADNPTGDPDARGTEPVPDAPEPAGSTAVAAETGLGVGEDQYVQDQGEETTRPRPIVPDASGPSEEDASRGSAESGGRDGMEPAAEEPATSGADDAEEREDSEEPHVQAAEYLAVAPVPVDPAMDEREDAGPTGTESESPSERRTEDVIASDDPVADDDDDADDPTPGEQSVDSGDDEMEATQAVPVAVVAVDAETTAAVPDGLYRAGGAESSAVADETYPDVDVEEERLQARLDAERQAREQRLGAVATSSENASREDAGPARITTDRFFPSFSLFVLRLVTASILGVTSWQILGSGVDETANFLAGYPLIPEPRLVAWILGFTLAALALLLVIGLLQRLVGLLLLAIAVATLTFIRWGSFSIFQADTSGFLGDRDLLLAAVGLLLLGMGGGRWGIDGAFRASRAASKAEREG